MHALKDPHTTSCSSANKYIAKAAHDKPETRKYKNADSTDCLNNNHKADVRSFQHFSIQANILYKKGWLSVHRVSTEYK